MSRGLANGDGLVAWMRERVPAIVAMRSVSFRRCDECGETSPPEWMHGDELCQRCAVKNHGIVY